MRYTTFRNLVLAGAVGVGAVGVYAVARNRPAPAPEPAAPKAAPAKQAPVPAVPASTAPQPAAAAVSAVPASAAPATTAEGEPLRPMDREILDRVAKGISGDKAKDAVPGRPWKVNLYRDPGDAGVSRAKIDLNRNERWEEKWTFESKGGQSVVKRQVAPADDEKYTVEYRLDGDHWRRK